MLEFLRSLDQERFIYLNLATMSAYVLFRLVALVCLERSVHLSRAALIISFLVSAAATGIGMGVFLNTMEWGPLIVMAFCAMAVWSLIFGATLRAINTVRVNQT